MLVTLIPTSAVLAQSQPAAKKDQGPNRIGFTLLLNMGVGWQTNEFADETATGLGGLNLGIGGFVSPKLAIMFRFSGTNVTYSNVGPNSVDINGISGTGGPVVQFWLNDYVNFEAGGGLGIANTDPGTDESGFGLILGVGLSFFHRGKNSLQVGVECSPVFVNDTTVNNMCIAFGWQLL